MRKIRWMPAATLLILSLAGCSFQAALDKLVPRERQAELVSVGQRFCTDPESVTPALHPGVVRSVKDAVPLLPRECPGAGATWELASYQWNGNITNGLKQRQEEVVVVGTGRDKWTTVSLRFYAENDAPLKVVAWNIVGSKTKPAALTFVENYDKTAGTMRIVIPVLLLVIAVLAGWLVWRWRRKRAA